MFHYVTSLKEFVRFDLPDAFVSGSFYPNAQYKTALGDLLFGHTNGFLWIEPSRIKVNRNKAKEGCCQVQQLSFLCRRGIALAYRCVALSMRWYAKR